MHAACHHGERAPALSGQHPAPEEPVSLAERSRAEPSERLAGAWGVGVGGPGGLGPQACPAGSEMDT